MKLILETPVKLRIVLEGEDKNILNGFLSYKDKKAEYSVRRFSESKYNHFKYGNNFNQIIQSLQDKITVSLLFEDDNGIYTYSGLRQYLENIYKTTFESKVEYPEFGLIPWARNLDFQPREVQLEINRLLLDIKHGAVEAATGIGKSIAMMLLAKEIALKTIVVVPTLSIQEQMYFLFGKYLGFKYVGRYGGKKKQTDRLITIVSAKAILSIKEGNPLLKAFKETKVLLTDESHLIGAECLSKISTEFLPHVPYRMYYSGTQTRNDGSDLKLQSIIGPVVKRISVKDGINLGVLATPSFHIFKVPSSVHTTYSNASDALKIIRKNLLLNDKVYDLAADIANKAVQELKLKVLILVDELKQFNLLYPRLKVRTAFAFGSLNQSIDLSKCRNTVVGDPIIEPPALLVDKFERGDFSLLVGTGAIGIGTDIPSVDMLILLQGGRSVIKIKQAIGRAIRATKTKKICQIVDFDIYNIPLLHNMAKSRISIYREISDDIQISEGFINAG